MGSRNLDLGIELVSAAIEADTKGRYFEARRLYTEGLDNFDLVLKYERNEKSREVIERKYKEYSERLEIIKKHLDEKGGNNTIPGALDSPNIIKGLEATERALGHDEKGQLSQAFRYYQHGLDYLVLALKFCTDTNTKQGLRTTIARHLDSAERIKAQMERENSGGSGTNPPPAVPPVTTPAAASQSSNQSLGNPQTAAQAAPALTMEDLKASILSGNSGPST